MCKHQAYLEGDDDFASGPECGKQAKWLSCVPFTNTPSCDEHKCRCNKPLRGKRPAAPTPGADICEECGEPSEAGYPFCEHRYSALRARVAELEEGKARGHKYRDKMRVRIAELEAEHEGARLDGDLRSAQLLMVGSEICGDPKIDPNDTRDPRHTPTLRRARALRLRAEKAETMLEAARALPAKWRKFYARSHYESAAMHCADTLETALASDSPTTGKDGR